MPEPPPFNDVYDGFKDLVYNLALHYSQNTTDAEDITQEVFVKIYQHLPKYNTANASLKTWIYRITINHCLDFIKWKRSRKRLAFITGIFNSSSNTHAIDFDHPGILLEDKQEMQHLFSAINTLPGNQKTALILTRIEDKSQKEVAEIMGISVKAVESLLQRAKQHLNKKLNKQ